MKNQYVSTIKIGERVDDIFVLTDKQVGHKKDGNLFMNLVFSDKTGQIRAVMWDNCDNLLKKISVGDFVSVKGYVGEYREKPQLVLRETHLIVDGKAFKAEDFLPVSGKNVESMFSSLVSVTNTIENPYLGNLSKLFWEDKRFVDRFKLAPAAKHLHHAYIGGLLEHTLSMAIIGQQISDHYSGVDRDLLLSGIVFHDVGKVEELGYTNKIDYTDKGRLLSHIVIGVLMIDEKIKKIPDFPEQTEYLLKHLIVSHHGVKEFGSPEVPKTVEAILLSCVDNMDFQVNSVRHFIDSDDTDGYWTSYNKLMKRYFYKGNN